MEHIFGMKYSTSGVTILKGQFKLTNTSQANQMLFQFSKTSRIFIDKKIVNLEEKEFLLLKPSQIITIESNVEDTMIFLFTLSDDLITSTNRNYQIIFENNKWNKKLISNIESIGVSLNKLISNLLNDNHEISFQTISLSFEFLYEFINVFAAEYSTSSKELKKLEISNYIELNYRSELTLNSISQQFNMSSSYFSRYFKQLFEIGFLEFLTNYRIKRISKELLFSSDKIATIAEKNGFSNLSSFNKNFKLQTGMSPREYRKKAELNQKDENLEENLQIQTAKLANTSEHGSDDVTIKQVNLSNYETLSKLRYPWKQLINIGSAQDLLQYDVRKHVVILKRELNFSYVRFWNVFTKSMNIDPTISENYNFDKLDSIFDFLLENDILPFIELSYKIKRVHRNAKDAIVFENEDFKFSLNSKEWFDMIRKFMKHVLNRYGKKVVSQWYFEFSFNYASEQECDEQIRHYKKTYSIIKEFATTINIGGPGAKTTRAEHFDYVNDLKRMSSLRVPFDFISYMVYPYLEDKKGERFSKISSNPDFLKEKVSEISMTIAETIYQDIPIYITEWSNTISNRSAINDTVFKGAYVIKNMIQIADKLAGIGYWVGSDLFGEHADSNTILHGGTGLLTKNGIAKPPLHALHFLNFLQEEIIAQNADLIVTKSVLNEYSIVLTNCKELHPSFYIDTKENKFSISDIETIFIDQEEKHYQFTWTNQSSQKYEIKVFRINQTNGNVLAGWEDLGYRTSFKKQDIDYLSKTSAPHVSIKQLQTHEGVSSFSLILEPNEFIYLSIIELY